MSTVRAPLSPCNRATVPLAALVADSTPAELRALVADLAHEAPAPVPCCSLWATADGMTYPATEAPLCHACCQAVATEQGFLLAEVRADASLTSTTGLIACDRCGVPLLAALTWEGEDAALDAMEVRLVASATPWGPRAWREVAMLLDAVPDVRPRLRAIIADALLVSGRPS